MDRSKIQIYLLCLIIVAAFSCKEKEPKFDCGCESATFRVVKDANASYLGKGILQIQLVSEEKEFYESFVTACSISDTLKITPDVRKPDYIVSGNIKNMCVDKNLILDQMPPKFEIKKIEKIL